MKRGDWQFEYVKRRLRDGIFVPHREIEAFVKALDGEPAAPAPERIVVSDRATLAYWWAACPVPAPIGESPKTVDVPAGLRAAFKVMLRDALTDLRGWSGVPRSELYRDLTDEPWPE